MGGNVVRLNADVEISDSGIGSPSFVTTVYLPGWNL